MPSAITLCTSGHSACGRAAPRRRVSSIQIMSPCAPLGEPFAQPLGASAAPRRRARRRPRRSRARALSRSSSRSSKLWLAFSIALLLLNRAGYVARGRLQVSGERRSSRSRRKGLVKRFDGKPAVDGIDLAVPEGSDLRHPRAQRRRQDHDAADAARHHRARRGRAHAARPRTAARGRARIVGYLPEERGLYPAMKAREAIAFMGALRGLPLDDRAQARARCCSSENGLGDYVDKPIKSLSKGMAQTVQLLGTIVHEPRAGRARRALLRASTRSTRAGSSS